MAEVIFRNVAEWMIYARSWSGAVNDSWRARVLRVVLPVVELHYEIAEHDEAKIDTGRLNSDLAFEYPFGERKHHPYKVWLSEMKILRTAMLDEKMSWDEFDICEVAFDMVEVGRVEEAIALLDKEAPNRLGRKCPACGSLKGHPCKEAVVENVAPSTQQELFFKLSEPKQPKLDTTKAPVEKPRFTDRIVPCWARIRPRTERKTA